MIVGRKTFPQVSRESAPGACYFSDPSTSIFSPKLRRHCAAAVTQCKQFDLRRSKGEFHKFDQLSFFQYPRYTAMLKTLHTLHKPYVNRVTLSRQNPYLYCSQSLEQKVYLQRVQDLSKEVLWVSVCQRAPKSPAVKVRGLTKSSAMRPESSQKSAAQVRVPGQF